MTVVLLAIFGGILYGTQMIVRSLGNFSIAGLFTSRTGTTVRDVPLRSEANARSTQLGWVPSGSRVRIVGENDSWFEVEIVQFGRPREADWMTRGWIAKKAKSSEDNVDFSR
ncbi:MAG: SH3 domain-containing protein [Acidobacteria bacterium]|nr:SH3 domain-containing protein [Acidobacteriota bacterium]